MTTPDMAASIVPRSDQLNAEDLLAGARTVTITGVRRGASAEQPVDIHLAEFDRPFKPSKTVRRILVAAWGPDAATYVGRRMTIYRDPLVRFGGAEVGGIRISHLSHIDRRMSIALTVTRGKRAPYAVEPLATPAPQPEPTAPGEPGRADQRASVGPPSTAEADGPMAKSQMAKMKALFASKGITDPAAKRTYCSETLDREISSVTELTFADAAAVINRLLKPIEE